MGLIKLKYYPLALISKRKNNGRYKIYVESNLGIEI